MNKLLLVDGSSLLVTSFFGNVTPDYYITGDPSKLLKTSEGIYTNGVFTMTRTLLKIIKKQKITHIAVAFDVSRNTFRRKIYPEYKAHRKETAPELKEQFQTMQDLLDKMNIPQFKLDNFEADDIIGTFAKKFKENASVFILTKDQDALQLIDEKIRVWLMMDKIERVREMYKERGIDTKILDIPDKVFEYTPITFEEVYGIKPIQMIDKKAIEGDTSDNIPGVKGVGEKATTPLLQEFGTLEEIYKYIENMSKEEEKEFKTLLKDLGINRSPLNYLLKHAEKEGEIVGKEAAFLSKKLATIITDISEYDSLEFEKLKLDLNEKNMNEEFKRLEFKSLVEAEEENEIVIKTEKKKIAIKYEEEQLTLF